MTKNATTVHRLATHADLGGVFDFLSRYLPNESKEWFGKQGREYVSKHIAMGLCVISECGDVKAVVMGRPVSDVIEQGVRSRDARDNQGDTLWVECAASIIGLTDVWNRSLEILSGYGCKLSKVAWNRCPFDDTPRVFPIDAVGRMLA